MRMQPNANQITTIVSLVLITVKEIAGGDLWGYEDKKAWADLKDSFCTGTKQSPINLVASKALKSSTEPLIFGPTKDTRGILSMSHNAVKFTVPDTTNYTVSGGPLRGVYKLAQFHMHAKSEHKFDGMQTDVEIHFVHHKAKFADLGAAVSSGEYDALAVVGVFADKLAGMKVNPAFYPISETLAKGSTMPENVTLSPYDLLPADRSKFFHYNGSLTTPTCNEVVQWIALTSRVKIYEFNRSKAVEKLMNNNFRDVISRDAEYNVKDSTKRVMLFTVPGGQRTNIITPVPQEECSGNAVISLATVLLIVLH